MQHSILKTGVASVGVWILSMGVTFAQPTIVHQSVANYTAGSSFQVTNSFSYTGQLLSLLWRPQLPSGWTLGTVAGDGNPESNFGEIMWTGSLPASPIKMVYTVQVPAGQSGSKQVRGEVEYQFSGSANPVTAYAAPDPLALNASGGGPTGPAITAQPQSQTVMAGASVSFSVTATGTAPLSYQWRKDVVNLTGATGASYTIPNVQAAHAGGYTVVVSNAAASVTSANAVLTVSPTAGTPAITQQSVSNYTVGSSLQVTNSFTYTGQLLSLLWRPKLPAGWTLGAVSGDGNPESNFGEIVWTGSLPASPIKMVYTVQVPAGQSGSKQVRGEVEYQFSGSANPVSGYAGPDPMAISATGGTSGPTITHQSAASYIAGSSLQVTNSFTYTGQLLSLLWRPQLPSGWTLGTVAGDGNPESNFGEIVWTGSLPASPIKMVYTVQVPAGQSGSKQVRGEVEYQFSGSANPVTAYAAPDPLALNASGGGPTGPAITARQSGQTLLLTVPAVSGYQIKLQSTADLLRGAWTDVPNTLTNANAPRSFTLPISRQSQEFYRAVLFP